MFKRNPTISKDAIMAALSKVNEPELNKDLVSLNMIRDLEVKDGAVSFTIVLTTPACPLKHVMERDCKAALAEVPGIESITVNWDAEVRGDPRIAGRLDLGIKNTIAVASGKGGVGKSTVAVNLAVALAQTGASVGLLDADIYGPNCNIMMGVYKLPPPQNQKIVPAVAHGVKVMSMGLLVNPEQALIWRGPMLHSAIRQFITDVAWGDLDYLIVDLPPGTGDAQLSLAQALPLTGGVIVTLPQKVSQADALRGLESFNQLNIPIIGVVENMGAMVLSDGSKLDVFGEGGGAAFADEVDALFLGTVPMDPQVRVGGDSGTPILLSHPDTAAAVALTEIAQKIAARVSVMSFEKPQGMIEINMMN